MLSYNNVDPSTNTNTLEVAREDTGAAIEHGSSGLDSEVDTVGFTVLNLSNR